MTILPVLIQKGASTLRRAWQGADPAAKLGLKIGVAMAVGGTSVIVTGASCITAMGDQPHQPSYSDQVAHECKTGTRLAGQGIHPMQRGFACAQRPGAWLGSALAK